MNKQSGQGESIYNLSQYLKEDNIFPIYFFFGEDSYTIQKSVKQVVAFVEPLILSEFDREVFEAGKETSLVQVIDLASVFPFGGGKRLLVVKNFDKISERKAFTEYVKDPPDFTILVVTQSGKKLDGSKEPFKSLIKNGWLFVAHELKGVMLQNWIVQRTKELKLSINSENAKLMIDLIGENKALIEMNLQKFLDYLGEGKEVTPESISELSSKTKEFTVFNLLDAVGKGRKKDALEISFKLIEDGSDLVYIITMLSRFLATVAQSMELAKLTEMQASKEAGVSIYYYRSCAAAKFLKSHTRLRNCAQALLEADIALKSTTPDPKSLVTILISRMLS